MNGNNQFLFQHLQRYTWGPIENEKVEGILDSTGVILSTKNGALDVFCPITLTCKISFILSFSFKRYFLASIPYRNPVYVIFIHDYYCKWAWYLNSAWFRFREIQYCLKTFPFKSFCIEQIQRILRCDSLELIEYLNKTRHHFFSFMNLNFSQEIISNLIFQNQYHNNSQT